MRIYVINGLPKSGKTTFGEVVGGILADRNVSFAHTSSINPVKAILIRPGDEKRLKFLGRYPSECLDGFDTLRMEVLGASNIYWDGDAKTDFFRGAMSKVKAKLPIELIHDYCLIQGGGLGERGVLFVDAREPEYIESFSGYARERGHTVKTVLIHRPGLSGADNPSDSQATILGMTYDYKIDTGNIEGDVKLGLTPFVFDFLTSEGIVQKDIHVETTHSRFSERVG